MGVVSDHCVPRRAKAIALFALAFVAIAAGCGGSDDDPGPASAAVTSEPTPLTRAELIAKADAICVATRRTLRHVTAKAFKYTHFPNPSETLPNVQYSEQVLGVAKKAVRRLRALTPPAGVRSDYEAYLRAEEEVEDLAEQALQASIDDDGGAYLKARKTRDAGALERANFAEAIGLRRCSPNPFGPRRSF
jgi:hypothetical protein